MSSEAFLSLFHCSVPIPSRTVRNSTTRLLARYEVIRVLGAGNYGVTYEARDVATEKIVAVKIAKGGHMEDVLDVCNRLNGISGDSPVFVYTYGYHVVSGWPLQWRVMVKEWPKHMPRDARDPFIVCLMQRGDRPITDATIDWTDSELRLVTWMIIHGIYTAKKAFGFQHQDLHKKNILLREVGLREKTRFRFQDRSYLIQDTRYLPMIIDFDLARYKPNGSGSSCSKEQRQAMDCGDTGSTLTSEWVGSVFQDQADLALLQKTLQSTVLRALGKRCSDKWTRLLFQTDVWREGMSWGVSVDVLERVLMLPFFRIGKYKCEA